MATSTALVVGDRTAITGELGNVLRLCGYETIVATPDEVVARLGTMIYPDSLILPAELGLHRIALLSEHFTREGRAPTTVIYPEQDTAALETCVRAGFDYITPPFAPSLLRARLTTCWERRQLTLAVEDMAAVASLHSYEHDLAVAHEIQQSGFLPDRLPERDGWELAAKFHPARLVAGDFYDAFELVGGKRLALLVGDVCDKGVGAALFMALIRTMLRHTAEQAGGWDMPEFGVSVESDTLSAIRSPLAPTLAIGAGPLLQAVSGTNSYVARHHREQGYFCTLFFGILDPALGVLVYINGGHNPAVLVRADGGHVLLKPTGPAVGMFANSSYLIDHVRLRPGDWLFAYTDGVPETRSTQGEFFGMDRTLEIVTQPGRTAAELIEAVDGALRHHVGAGEQHDDITMLALRRSPRSRA
jgi:phosphoserine phosphatase RsbU/P